MDGLGESCQIPNCCGFRCETSLACMSVQILGELKGRREKASFTDSERGQLLSDLLNSGKYGPMMHDSCRVAITFRLCGICGRQHGFSQTCLFFFFHSCSSLFQVPSLSFAQTRNVFDHRTACTRRICMTVNIFLLHHHQIRSATSFSLA